MGPESFGSRFESFSIRFRFRRRRAGSRRMGGMGAPDASNVPGARNARDV
ncbi:hypothetical protein BMA10247_1296 [Burkholderia mallei NCTC 10247]|nr:hypothetical protein BMASAVP1_A2025 [Burkholderia mallei SAVP1]ABO06381.1 hypothetical protein BMA10247_1296 [Burkholderia mallei NCTC 10247]EEH23831.1 conserved hypothetical protein [Burkholderia pseudomallei Pakistan 9]EEP86083.1 conserved hypothetical protein [Burkholderia mallei GB8 horse 4]